MKISSRMLGILIIIFGGLFILGYGIYVLCYKRIIDSGLILMIFGTLVASFGIVAFDTYKRDML